MAASMKFRPPPMCPRCGHRKFARDEISIPATAVVNVRVGIWRCDSCRLSFDGETWRDEVGEVWTMAESGT